MNLRTLFQLEPQKIPIPAQFRKTENGALFSACQVCERNLLEEGVPYMIEKAVRRYPQYQTEDVLFEYALCMTCYQDISGKISQPSNARIQAFIERRTRLGDRAFELLKTHSKNPAAWLQECVVTGTPLTETTEYTVCAQALGDELILGVMPYGLSGAALDEMMALLSQETQDAFDDFRDDFLGGPPHVEDFLDPKRRPVFI